MKRHLLATSLALALALSPVLAHDLFLIVGDHDVRAATAIEIELFNGTFDKSENAIARDRMVDVTLVDGAGKQHEIPAASWRDDGPKAIVSLESGPAGTAVFGVSTKPRLIEMDATAFNDYLVHDGVLDTLEERKKNGTDDQPARESYAKHVKTVLRVGDQTSDCWKTVLGYPVEFVPTSDPFALEAGGALELSVLADGKPLPNQLVYASHEGYHGHGADGSHQEAVKTRSDKDGKITVPVQKAGRWYVRLIHMTEDASGEYDYISQWATLTFEVGG